MAGAEALLDSALKHWQKAQQQNPRDELAHEGLGWCLQRLVSLKLSLGKAAEAMALYLQLSKLGLAGDVAGAATLAKLVRAAAVKGDSNAIAQLQQELPGEGEEKGEGRCLSRGKTEMQVQEGERGQMRQRGGGGRRGGA